MRHASSSQHHPHHSYIITIIIVLLSIIIDVSIINIIDNSLYMGCVCVVVVFGQGVLVSVLVGFGVEVVLCPGRAIYGYHHHRNHQHHQHHQCHRHLSSCDDVRH